MAKTRQRENMSVLDSVKSVFVPIHREGHMFIGIFAVVTLVLTLIWAPLGFVGLVLTVWCVYFFRDPDRTTPVREGLTISPADGKVVSVAFAPPPPELEMGTEPRLRIGIFMNVFDVHVNRSPCDGTITKKVYSPGLFINATLDKASEDNERMALRMTTASGKDIAFVQIAGLVARRIVTPVAPGDLLRAGERFGIIRFGSRVDVYLDEGMKPLVSVGQTAIAGETVLADEGAVEPPHRGEVR
ncbi:phosphatidylserine decarboxylase [Iodidimonas sp. SYSU 1G8]|uniref:phosphatidylserine decarboxylase n=1 Tax=Iodidimonas sp. SYSU 1G8 TaxID=3133967 RepID=UPI0031FE4729